MISYQDLALVMDWTAVTTHRKGIYIPLIPGNYWQCHIDIS